MTRTLFSIWIVAMFGTASCVRDRTISHAAIATTQPVIAGTQPTTAPTVAAPQLSESQLAAYLDVIDDPIVNMHVRLQACWDLAALGPAAAPITDDLLTLTYNDSLRPHLLMVLRAIGPEAAVPLARAIVHGNTFEREAAATVLWDMGPGVKRAVPELARLLADDERSRRLAVELLDGVAPYAAEAKDALRACASDPDSFVSSRAVSALERLRLSAAGLPLPAALSQLEYQQRVLALIETAHPLLHAADAEAEGSSKPQVDKILQGETVDRFARLLLHGSDDEQTRALEALALLASERFDARSALIEAVLKGDSRIQLRAAIELANRGLGRTRVEKVLEAAIDKQSGADQMRTALALATVDPSDKWIVPAAMEALEEGADASVRTLALRVLAKLPKRPAKAEPFLWEHLRDSDYDARMMSLAMIENDGPLIPRELTAASEVLVSTPEKAGSIADALLALGERAIPLLPRLIVTSVDSDLKIRCAALYVLSRTAPTDPHVNDAITQAVRDAQEDPRELAAIDFRIAALDAANALPQPPAALARPAVDLAVNADPRVSAAACNLLRRVGSPAVSEIKGRYAPHSADAILRAASILAPAHSDAMRILLDGLQDPSPNFRAASVSAFGGLGEAARPHLESLRLLLRDDVPVIRLYTLNAIAGLGPVASELADPVAAFSTGADAFRDPAVLTLAKIAPSDPRAIPGLVALIDRSTGDAHVAAIGELISLNSIDPAFIAAVTGLLDAADNAVRLRAVTVLATQGARAHSAAGKLARMVDNEYPAIRDAAARALLRVEPDAPALSAAYLAAVRHHDVEVRGILAPAIRKLDPTAAPKLLPRLNELAANDPDEAVRATALSALKDIGRE